jgi:hypothetical protein
MSQNGKMGREMRQECCYSGLNATMGQNVSSYGKKWNTKYVRTKCKPITNFFLLIKVLKKERSGMYMDIRFVYLNG